MNPNRLHPGIVIYGLWWINHEKLKIAIFGGSFNPIHTGHAILANHIAEVGLADEVWLMVSRLNPLKNDCGLASFNHRMEMAKIVASASCGVSASDFEFHLPSPSYTYRTLLALSEKYPEHEFRLLTGSDNWLIFDKWRDYEKIIKEFGVIVYPRPGYPVEEDGLPDNVVIADECPQILISSSYIRQQASEGRGIRFLVPEGVERYIEREGLYRR